MIEWVWKLCNIAFESGVVKENRGNKNYRSLLNMAEKIYARAL